MFGRDPRCKLSHLLVPRLRYLGDSNAKLSLNVLHAIYWIVLENYRRIAVSEKGHTLKQTPFQPNDLVFVKNHTAKAFDKRYQNPHRILSVHRSQLVLVDIKGEKSVVDKSQVRRLPTQSAMIACLPKHRRAGRGSRYHIDPNSVPPPITSSPEKGEGSRGKRKGKGKT